jgi:hypothetical protein
VRARHRVGVHDGALAALADDAAELPDGRPERRAVIDRPAVQRREVRQRDAVGAEQLGEEGLEGVDLAVGDEVDLAAAAALERQLGSVREVRDVRGGGGAARRRPDEAPRFTISFASAQRAVASPTRSGRTIVSKPSAFAASTRRSASALVSA